jgi:hypothetical protein
MKKTGRPSEQQVGRFKDAARELGCDESEAAFDEKLKKIVARRPSAEKNQVGEHGRNNRKKSD